jgi:glucose-6-phosphate 1-epimerase
MWSPDETGAGGDDPCRRLLVTASDGTRLEACAHGGHLTRWWPSGVEESRLWLSRLSRCGAGSAIRGGVPVIFPQFGGLGLLRRHGLVRDVAWQARQRSSGGDATLTFDTLVEPAPQWPYRALVTLRGLASGDRLEVSLEVENRGDAPLSFTAALHTYLAVSRAADASVEGLAGCAASDALTGGTPTVLGLGPLGAAGPRDLMVSSAPDVLTLNDAGRPSLRVAADGFGSWVVWNPGPGHGLPDVGDGDEEHFVCVEPAALDPVTLEPRQVWIGSLTLTVQR